MFGWNHDLVFLSVIITASFYYALPVSITLTYITIEYVTKSVRPTNGTSICLVEISVSLSCMAQVPLTSFMALASPRHRLSVNRARGGSASSPRATKLRIHRDRKPDSNKSRSTHVSYSLCLTFYKDCRYPATQRFLVNCYCTHAMIKVNNSLY